jgi:hypothetical protein
MSIVSIVSIVPIVPILPIVIRMFTMLQLIILIFYLPCCVDCHLNRPTGKPFSSKHTTWCSSTSISSSSKPTGTDFEGNSGKSTVCSKCILE